MRERSTRSTIGSGGGGRWNDSISGVKAKKPPDPVKSIMLTREVGGKVEGDRSEAQRHPSADELNLLAKRMNASEIQNRSGWYLLAYDGANWRTVGGPYNTRGEARTARRVADEQWRAVPWEIRAEYYRTRR